MFPFITADVGGTNARFSLAVGKQGGKFIFEHQRVLKGEHFPQFGDALTEYIDGLGGIKPTAACVAIAAPIDGDLVEMTNLPWSFSQQAMCEKFGLNYFFAINDYTAVALAASRLDDEDLLNVVPGTRQVEANKAVLGPGTGLGVGGLAFSKKGWVVIPAEGGHVNMAPSTEFEAELIKAAIPRFGYASAETFVSGPGIVNLYNVIADVRGVQAEQFEPQDVSARALDNTDETCRLALETFCAFLGTVSSNLVLTYGAKGGVYITGGIVPRFVDFVKASPFAERFKNKGVMSHYVEDVPVDLVTYKDTAYLGAAAWLEQVIQDDLS